MIEEKKERFCFSSPTQFHLFYAEKIISRSIGKHRGTLARWRPRSQTSDLSLWSWNRWVSPYYPNPPVSCTLSMKTTQSRKEEQIVPCIRANQSGQSNQERTATSTGRDRISSEKHKGWLLQWLEVILPRSSQAELIISLEYRVTNHLWFRGEIEKHDWSIWHHTTIHFYTKLNRSRKYTIREDHQLVERMARNLWCTGSKCLLTIVSMVDSFDWPFDIAGRGSCPSTVGTNGNWLGKCWEKSRRSPLTSSSMAAGQGGAPSTWHSQFSRHLSSYAWKDCMLTPPIAIVPKSAICLSVDPKAFTRRELSSSLLCSMGCI